jgi:hypothetical protein
MQVVIVWRCGRSGQSQRPVGGAVQVLVLFGPQQIAIQPVRVEELMVVVQVGDHKPPTGGRPCGGKVNAWDRIRAGARLGVVAMVEDDGFLGRTDEHADPEGHGLVDKAAAVKYRADECEQLGLD